MKKYLASMLGIAVLYNINYINPLLAQDIGSFKLSAPVAAQPNKDKDLDNDDILNYMINDLTQAYQRSEFSKTTLDSYLDSMKNHLLVLPEITGDSLINSSEDDSYYDWSSNFIMKIKSSYKLTVFMDGFLESKKVLEEYVNDARPIDSLYKIISDPVLDPERRIIQALRQHGNSRLYVFDNYNKEKGEDQVLIDDISEIKRNIQPGSQHLLSGYVPGTFGIFKQLCKEYDLSFRMIIPLTKSTKADILKAKVKNAIQSGSKNALYCDYDVWDGEMVLLRKRR
ncbi:MAG: hypothetical protein AABX52_03060 [Nanoarchaeota archaeon]